MIGFMHGYYHAHIVYNYKTRDSLDRRPDAILMDIRIPVMDGIDAMRQIMAERPPCIVALSALAERDAIARAEEAGARAYLTKPASIEEVVRTLQVACGECP
jgi:CheY-like chemotaxis protein